MTATSVQKHEVAALTIFAKGGKPYLVCFVTGKVRRATPTEIVRQLYLRRLIVDCGYPTDRIGLGKPVWFGARVLKRALDIVVWEEDPPTRPYIIVVCRTPQREVGLEQIKAYCDAVGATIGVWTNGGKMVALRRVNPDLFRRLSDIPTAAQTRLLNLTKGQLRRPLTRQELADACTVLHYRHHLSLTAISEATGLDLEVVRCLIHGGIGR